MQAAGRPVYFKQQENWGKSNTDRNERIVQNGGKKRYPMPIDEIDEKNIFLMPNGSSQPDNRIYAQIAYDRNLMNDDIEGTKAGTRLNPSLKNLLKAKWMNQAQFRSQQAVEGNFQQKQIPQQYQQYSQRQQQMQDQPEFSKPQLKQLYPQQQQNIYPGSSRNFNNQSCQIPFKQNQFRSSSNSFQENGKNIVFNNNRIELPKKINGIWGFSNIGVRSSHPVYKFGKGLRDMDVL